MIARLIALAALVLAAAGPAAAQTPGTGSPVGSCGVCHGKEATAFQLSAHASVGIDCVACHGGDPTQTTKKACVENPTFTGIPKGKSIVEHCGGCHSNVDMMRQFNLSTDQLALYKSSPHGKRLFENNDPNVPTCIDCHGIHDIRPVTDPESPAHRSQVPKTCARCHADEKRMKPYGLPSDVYEKYAGSVHGRGLIEKKQLRLPHCGDCHSSHGARPAGVKEVVNVCGHCHVAVREQFLKSPHFVAATKGKMEECTSCHGHHDIAKVADPVRSGWDYTVCRKCHDPSSPTDKAWATAQHMSQVAETLRRGIQAAASKIDEAKARGIITATEENWLNEARHYLVQTGPVGHATSDSAFNALVQGGTGTVSKVVESVDVKLRRIRDRRIVAVLVFGILAVLVLAMNLKLRRLRRTPSGRPAAG